MKRKIAMLHVSSTSSSTISRAGRSRGVDILCTEYDTVNAIIIILDPNEHSA